MLKDEWIEQPSAEEAEAIDRHNHAVDGIERALRAFLAALAVGILGAVLWSRFGG